ncbi:MAG: anhydro-N-acetylmuramic acid kinase [Silicimonas sp.]|nr:anhydro-N-acetylmuramic acid kinase [Silicimonas sp.]
MSDDGAIWALGAMSGTSLDGVDAAMIRTDGATVFEFGKTAYRPYSKSERAVLRKALEQISGPDVEAAAEVVEVAHAELLGEFDGAEIVGFHGQTLFHRPDQRETVQVGDGQVLAEALDVPVVWDFRTADVTLGGEGAPLAPFYHFALAKTLKSKEPLVFLNIGGVANLTWIDPAAEAPEQRGACLAFDTGPGNAKIDDLMQARRGEPMDEDGVLTEAGAVHEDLLDAMTNERYLQRMPPKSLDRNDFTSWSELVAPLSDEDAVATLAAGTAATIAQGLELCPRPPAHVFVTGGGRRNPGLMQMIAALAPCPVSPVEAAGFDGDMIEAQAFAYLAVRVFGGFPTSAPGTTGVAAPVGGGKISTPGALGAMAQTISKPFGASSNPSN